MVAEGRSVTEATEIAQGLARKIAESCIEHGDPLPPALIDFVEPETGLDLLVPISVPSWGGLPVSRYREVARGLRHVSYLVDREGRGSHEVWRHVRTGRKVTVPRHTGDMAEGTLRAILREAGIYVRDFVGAG